MSSAESQAPLALNFPLERGRIPGGSRVFARTPQALSRRYWLVAVAVAVASALALVLYVLPAILVGPDTDLTTAERLKAENDVRATLLQAVGGAVLLIGLYFTGRTYLLNRQGQLTDRFTHAIDQLGNKESLDVRLGGIYALERIAQESQRDHWPIVEVLTAFVREKPPRIESAAGEESANSTPPVPRADVQAVLTVLGRRNRVNEQAQQRLDLTRTDLRGVKLPGAHLESANLYQAHLEGGYLFQAHLEDAVLSEAHLEGANVSGAHLERALLIGAHLQRAELGGTNLEGAVITGAHLENAWLNSASLEGAYLGKTHLEGAYLGNARLGGADFTEATGLTPEQLAEVSTNESTRLPAGLSTKREGPSR
jgi:Pentapeptide repeats (8 copies)